MKIKNLLIGVLIFALIVEMFLTIVCFFAPKFGLQLFGLTYNDQTAFLAFIIAWFLLFISAFIVYILFLLKNNNTQSNVLIYAISIWWIGLGVTVYFMFNKIDNLFLDSLKGIILLFLNSKYKILNKVK